MAETWCETNEECLKKTLQLTIASIYIGLAVNYAGNDKANFCTVGTRIVRSVENCTKDFESDLFHQFCHINANIREAIQS